MEKADYEKELAEFKQLYEDNFNRLCHKVYRFTHDQEVAKDIVQEVFFKFWVQRHTLHISQSREAYLYQMVINRTLNYLKSHTRRQAIQKDLFVNSPEGNNSVEDTLYAHELEKRIQQAIDTLPQACKQVFLLNRYEELSYKEIAALLKISVNTVEKHIGKALKILRKHLIQLLLLTFSGF